ncbi:hypothetical protein AAFF_G00030210 [Aldrovandia affinis]|uniref:Uncharacterized protein n=1 Tax=Aldrovandia affinis TaxID=143900 RepID=A0AAD7S406_9TELE|nr:hypothetical protein AAFF_G00030210 [Aldrovandia affinis]
MYFCTDAICVEGSLPRAVTGGDSSDCSRSDDQTSDSSPSPPGDGRGPSRSAPAARLPIRLINNACVAPAPKDWRARRLFPAKRLPLRYERICHGARVAFTMPRVPGA